MTEVQKSAAAPRPLLAASWGYTFIASPICWKEREKQVERIRPRDEYCFDQPIRRNHAMRRESELQLVQMDVTNWIGRGRHCGVNRIPGVGDKHAG